jgi:hypothetical protein
VEVELEGEEEQTEEAEKCREGWIAKHDGSLSCGLEFVSQPRTWKAWEKTALDWFPGKAWNTSTCGLHIHVSRSACGGMLLYKVLRFFELNQAYIRRISRRKGEKLEQWAAIQGNGIRAYADEEQKNRFTLAWHAKGNKSGNKYQAVNVEHDKTIEFRIFKGTTNEPAIRRNLAWIHLMLAWLRDESAVGAFRLRPRHFHNWLESPAAVRWASKKTVASVLEISKSCV